eukprot:349649-Chlamydomonas_euryale.AAC.4
MWLHAKSAPRLRLRSSCAACPYVVACVRLGSRPPIHSLLALRMDPWLAAVASFYCRAEETCTLVVCPPLATAIPFACGAALFARLV